MLYLHFEYYVSSLILMNFVLDGRVFIATDLIYYSNNAMELLALQGKSSICFL